MSEHLLKRQLSVSTPLEECFDFFADAENLERITPPKLNFRILTPEPISISKGTLIDYRLKLRGIPITWKTEISEWEPPFRFVDHALKSPYKQWIHLHKFRSTEAGGTEMTDEVRYRLPFEPLGDLMHWFVERELGYIFDYRQKAVLEIFENERNSRD